MATTSDTPAPGPVRTCVGCRVRATKGELLRVVAGPDSTGQLAVVPDPTSTAPGRGAHLHPTTECYDLAVRRKAFARALRIKQGRGPGLSVLPVGDYLDSSTTAPPREDRPRNWSTSS